MRGETRGRGRRYAEAEAGLEAEAEVGLEAEAEAELGANVEAKTKFARWSSGPMLKLKRKFATETEAKSEAEAGLSRPRPRPKPRPVLGLANKLLLGFENYADYYSTA